MSTSLSYTVTQSPALPAEALPAIAAAFQRANHELPEGTEPLGFVAEDNPAEHWGSSKLPSDDAAIIPALLALFAGLSDARRAIPDALWEVMLDDTAVDWDEECGYSLPGL